MRNLFLLLLLISSQLQAQVVNIIPYPTSVNIQPGKLDLGKGLLIPAGTTETDKFANFLYLVIPEKTKIAIGTNVSLPAITFVKAHSNLANAANTEGYALRISEKGIEITAFTDKGLFYGCQSLIQLLATADSNHQLQRMDIVDAPAFNYRGMHLDVCRHFFGKEVIKQYLDLMAELKMNTFHWHLTDDQGWRIEIKKYPLLTEKGAWRTEKNGTRYGGYYTQDDIKEIVAYAAERYITIIPEIELPGHSSAAIAAYPFLSCSPGTQKTVPNTWGVKKDIYSPNDSTLRFIEGVLDEVCTLFPGSLIHMGGDEAPKDAWKKSASAQAVIEKERLKDEEQLQHYFLKRIENYLAQKGKRCIGWGEIVKGGLSDSVVVMSWLNKKAGSKALAHGNQVIMTPRSFCYFDYPASLKDKKHAWWMLYLTAKQVYKFNPYPAHASDLQKALVLGGQANVWTEYITTEAELKHQVMPRLAAMAEALWSQTKNYKSFVNRLNQSAVFKPYTTK